MKTSNLHDYNEQHTYPRSYYSWFLNADFTKVILKIKNHLEFINVKLNRTDFNIVEIL